MDKITVDIRENTYLSRPHGIRLCLYIQLPKNIDITTFESRVKPAKRFENILNDGK